MNASDLQDLRWRTSSYSSGQGGACVEVAPHGPMVAVRDSKNASGPKLIFDASAWQVFAQRVKVNEYDLRG
ncbi:DUF397 domain-containing protein [Actinomadura sp. NEAU-AAG7]|uniref:DUF397 domain-containing protein n=1 Tax=Actinomadura sp. NEAU-AAG7 TaxID=2839640 RepID=UPI001BE4B45E|nr:DUF397 domain-containing protein [Actinomadura sp. NEAU-AAG7]MBT2206607.1 DUF397 domain-containing protein [Actinomadura sp. NEAU-AAG7]